MCAIVLEVPDDELVPIGRRDQRIDVWALASLAPDAGAWCPVNQPGHTRDFPHIAVTA